MKTNRILALVLGTMVVAACGPGKNGNNNQPTPVPDQQCDQLADESAQAACESFPRLLDLQVGLMSDTCSPNPGVCHQTNNYPDMHTAGNLLGAIDAPCNVEMPDPIAGWDNCELPADVLMTGSGFSSDIAWIENVGTSMWQVGLRVAPTFTAQENVYIYDTEGNVVMQPAAEWQVLADLQDGVAEVTITIGEQDGFIQDYINSILATVVGGDRNRNGTFGADAGLEPASLVTPGNLELSYLWGRITGTVPGTRMPLANGPVLQPEYVAVACWIESLAGVEDPQATDYIDYQSCNFAANPTDYEIQDY